MMPQTNQPVPVAAAKAGLSQASRLSPASADPIPLPSQK